MTGPESSAVCVALDPVDGSTNASRGIPFFATSLCAIDAEGSLAATVANLASGVTYRAVRGAGATRDGEAIVVGPRCDLADAIVGLNGHTAIHLGWRQFRALGSAALELCAVADGSLDAYANLDIDGHGPWDYLGGCPGGQRGRRHGDRRRAAGVGRVGPRGASDGDRRVQRQPRRRDREPDVKRARRRANASASRRSSTRPGGSASGSSVWSSRRSPWG